MMTAAQLRLLLLTARGTALLLDTANCPATANTLNEAIEEVEQRELYDQRKFEGKLRARGLLSPNDGALPPEVV